MQVLKKWNFHTYMCQIAFHPDGYSIHVTLYDILKGHGYIHPRFLKDLVSCAVESSLVLL